MFDTAVVEVHEWCDERPYSVQLWHRWHGHLVCAGNGRMCRTEDEAREFARKNAARTRWKS